MPLLKCLTTFGTVSSMKDKFTARFRIRVNNRWFVWLKLGFELKLASTDRSLETFVT